MQPCREKARKIQRTKKGQSWAEADRRRCKGPTTAQRTKRSFDVTKESDVSTNTPSVQSNLCSRQRTDTKKSPTSFRHPKRHLAEFWQRKNMEEPYPKSKNQARKVGRVRSGQFMCGFPCLLPAGSGWLVGGTDMAESVNRLNPPPAKSMHNNHPNRAAAEAKRRRQGQGFIEVHCLVQDSCQRQAHP